MAAAGVVLPRNALPCPVALTVIVLVPPYGVMLSGCSGPTATVIVPAVGCPLSTFVFKVALLANVIAPLAALLLWSSMLPPNTFRLALIRIAFKLFLSVSVLLVAVLPLWLTVMLPPTTSFPAAATVKAPPLVDAFTVSCPLPVSFRLTVPLPAVLVTAVTVPPPTPVLIVTGTPVPMFPVPLARLKVGAAMEPPLVVMLPLPVADRVAAEPATSLPLTAMPAPGPDVNSIVPAVNPAVPTVTVPSVAAVSVRLIVPAVLPVTVAAIEFCTVAVPVLLDPPLKIKLAAWVVRVAAPVPYVTATVPAVTMSAGAPLMLPATVLKLTVPPVTVTGLLRVMPPAAFTLTVAAPPETGPSVAVEPVAMVRDLAPSVIALPPAL